SEDIINRGGATLVIELFGSDDAGNFAEGKGGTVLCDGIPRQFCPG
ncbi:MAG: D-lyxose/D-mannose family sugar isomerase, partial [Xanthomonadales bacterium]|nr:D-lyxose/D-mannose family sugar isomerase [Xanthomonadales bacterium]